MAEQLSSAAGRSCLLGCLAERLAPLRCFERSREVVGLANDLAVPQFDDRDRLGGRAVAVVDRALEDPQVVATADLAERKRRSRPGRLAVCVAHGLYQGESLEDLARLWEGVDRFVGVVLERRLLDLGKVAGRVDLPHSLDRCRVG